MTDTAKDAPKITMVFKGLEMNMDGKKAYCWLRLEGATSVLDDSSYGPARASYNKQIQKGATPGAVYLIPSSGDGSVFVNAGEYQGRYADEEQALKWQTIHHATRALFDVKAKAGVELKRRLDLEALEPFRCAYWNSSGTKQAHILALIIKAVTNPKRLR